jgi:hypothetical protein
MFEAFHDVEAKSKQGNKAAMRVMQSWADAEWFLTRPEVTIPTYLSIYLLSQIRLISLSTPAFHLYLSVFLLFYPNPKPSIGG